MSDGPPESSRTAPRVDVRYRIAAWLVIVQGAVMELGASLALPVLLLLDVNQRDLGNRVWGLALTVMMCAVTFVLMIFMLPAGIADGVLSGAAFVLILLAWFGPRSLSARRISDS